MGAWTTTSPAGKVIPGKAEHKKPIADIMAAHEMPYVATASIVHWKDLVEKARKGMEVNGPAFIHVFAPCPRGWRSETAKSVEISGLAVQTCIFPLWEAEYGKYKLSPQSKLIAKYPERKMPVELYLKTQGRFRHLFKPENRHILEEIQSEVDRRWQKLLKACEIA
jgi:pyruvate ferredoxin oxidoreductase beta subunit